MKWLTFIWLACSIVVSKASPTPSSSMTQYAVDVNNPALVESQEFSQSTASLHLEAKRFFLKVNAANQQLTTRNDGKAIKAIVSNCALCKTAVALVQFQMTLGANEKSIKEEIYFVCDTFNFETKEVCKGLAAVYGSNIVKILGKLSMSRDQICSFMLGSECADSYSPDHQWNIKLPNNTKPLPFDLPLPKPNAPRLKVLHLSDNHYDPFYVEGSNANCADPLCCRVTSGKPRVADDAAGKWGDYRNCDTPKRTIDHLLQHIAKTHHDIDYILWTGDLPPHDIWNQTRKHNLNIIRDTVAQINEHFPNTPIFPALGNHESAPVNMFAPAFVHSVDDSMSWLYNELDSLWKRWLPTNVSETVKRGAFYSIPFRSNFRIISLNMNYCNKENWWLLLNSTDPDTELQWFVEELQKAETAGEKVHVIGHIPPGDDSCLKVWSRNFYEIVARYESTIVAQFYGHTHYDEFEVFYDPANLTRPVNVAYIGPSVTPYYNLNPGYRIYYVDGDHKDTTRMVCDHETWIMNLLEANLNDAPVWYKLYSVLEVYGMKGLRPVDWSDLVERMAKNQSIFDTYYKFYWKDSQFRPSCDKLCRENLVCNAKSGRSHDRDKLCRQSGKISEPEMPKSWMFSIQDRMAKFLNMVDREVRLATNQLD